MVSSKGLFYNDEKTKLLLNTENEQIPVAAQIFGNDIEAMSFAAKQLSKTSPIIDINMGCPAPKVVKNGDGSKLLLNLELAGDIIEAVVKNSQVPVTLKMRKGWDDNNIVAVELAKIAEEKGKSNFKEALKEDVNTDIILEVERNFEKLVNSKEKDVGYKE